MTVDGELVAVVPVQPVLRCYPHHAVAGLMQLVDKTAGEVVVGGENAHGLCIAA